MSFATWIHELDLAHWEQMLETRSAADVERALARDVLDDGDIAALLSRAAAPWLETMARRAQDLTRRRFGRTMQMYAPVYLSNECVNRCTYCGFSHERAIVRTTLSPAQVLAEAKALRANGVRHLLIVSGEVPRTTGAGYVEQVLRELRPHFDSIAIETGTFGRSDYERIAAAGADGLTIYQETYLPVVYRNVHLAGPKAHYGRRLLAIEDGGEAGFRSLGVGALLGLSPFRLEAWLLAMHARYLSRRFWRCRIAVSFPRIRAATGGHGPAYPVQDAELVQMIAAFRLALPDAELVLSTRETAALRDALLGIGITRMSAGSKTNPGSYLHDTEAGEQFTVEDVRTPQEVAQAISARGFEPVWKDFDRVLVSRHQESLPCQESLP